MSALAPKVLLLVQGLALQGFAPAMTALGSFYDTIVLAPDVVHRDSKVHHWHDMAARQGSLPGLDSSIRAGFFGSAYIRGSASAAIEKISAVTPPDAATAASLQGLIGRLLRPANMPAAYTKKSDEPLIEAAQNGNPNDLCEIVRSEIVRNDASAGTGCPAEHTLLNAPRLDEIPLVIFTRGQTMLNYPGDQGEEFRQRAADSILAAANKGNKAAICWLADAMLRGLYGIPQDIETGLSLLQTGLENSLPRAMALEALRQLGWIRGVPGEDPVDRAWIKELLGMAASEDDCLGYVALVLLEAMEPAPQKRQKELAADMDKAILGAREQADASALYLFGCVASLHLEDPGLNAVCRYYDARHCRKSGETPYKSDFAAHTACATFTSAHIVGEPKALLLSSLVNPDLGNLAGLREAGKSLEEFM